MSVIVRALKFCRRPTISYIAAGLSFLLTLPALWQNLELDDYFHRAIFLGFQHSGFEARRPQQMFRFLSGNEAENQHLMDEGFLPWWTDRQIKAEFLQFLTVQTHVLDYQLWPNSPLMMHAHNMAWLALVAFLAAIWYRKLFASAATAGMAALLFAMDDAHGTPAGWVCNRNVLVACSFGLATLLIHHAWRGQGRAGGWRWAPWAWALFAASLFSKEEGLATSAYIGAYAFFLDRAPLWRRLCTLLPYTAIVFIWRYARDSMGYGISHIGLYIDPIDQPARFALAALERLPVLLLGQLALPPSEVYGVFKGVVGIPIMALAIGLIIFLAAVLWPILKTSPTARFSTCGMILAMIPVCATLPSDRLLVFPGIGGMALIAELVQVAWIGPTPSKSWPGWKRSATLLSLGWLLWHGVFSPLLLWHRAANPLGNTELGRSFYVQVPRETDLTGQTVVLVSAPFAIFTGYLPVLREFDGLTIPERTRVLAPSFSQLHIRRADEQTLIIRAEQGFASLALDELFRNEEHRLPRGSVITLAGLEVTVLDVTHSGLPLVAQFKFAEPLHAQRYRWLYWQAGQWAEFELPTVGEEIEIESPSPWDLVTTNWEHMPRGYKKIASAEAETARTLGNSETSP